MILIASMRHKLSFCGVGVIGFNLVNVLMLVAILFGQLCDYKKVHAFPNGVIFDGQR